MMQECKINIDQHCLRVPCAVYSSSRSARTYLGCEEKSKDACVDVELVNKPASLRRVSRVPIKSQVIELTADELADHAQHALGLTEHKHPVQCCCNNTIEIIKESATLSLSLSLMAMYEWVAVSGRMVGWWLVWVAVLSGGMVACGWLCQESKTNHVLIENVEAMIISFKGTQW
jgi:hypothetical protein